MSRLHIDVGQAHDVTPRALVGAITGESGIPGRSVGAIDIQNNFSIVEISAELAAHVLATLNKGVFISGVKVSAKAADETRPPAPGAAPVPRCHRPSPAGNAALPAPPAPRQVRQKTTGSHLGQKSLQRIAVKKGLPPSGGNPLARQVQPHPFFWVGLPTPMTVPRKSGRRGQEAGSEGPRGICSYMGNCRLFQKQP